MKNIRYNLFFANLYKLNMIRSTAINNQVTHMQNDNSSNHRVEVLYDRHDRRSSKIFASFVNFLRKQHLLQHNLHGNMKILCNSFVNV